MTDGILDEMQSRIQPRRSVIYFIFFLVVCALIFGFVIGNIYAWESALDWCVGVGFRFLEVKNVTIGIEEEKLAGLINQYKFYIDRETLK